MNATGLNMAVFIHFYTFVSDKWYGTKEVDLQVYMSLKQIMMIKHNPERFALKFWGNGNCFM